MDIDVERLAAQLLPPLLFTGLGLFAWLALVAQRAERDRGLVDLCRAAIRLREGQEARRGAGAPAPHLERIRRVEAELRGLLQRRGL